MGVVSGPAGNPLDLHGDLLDGLCFTTKTYKTHYRMNKVQGQYISRHIATRSGTLGAHFALHKKKERADGKGRATLSCRSRRCARPGTPDYSHL
jgi:hypothetical protein